MFMTTHDCRRRGSLPKENSRPPVLYELNTWVWLHGLGVKYGRTVDLSSVPAEEWDALADLDCDSVWLMGVWQRSPVGRQIALELPDLIAECHRILPDFTEDDLPGSPFSVKSYTVDERLGNLATARAELASRGLRLILDFVPNHVAPDHQWIFEHPEFFVKGDEQKLKTLPSEYFEANGAVIAYGRDPNFPPWTDTAQLNVFSPKLREGALDTLRHIAAQCDGVRCDMAMLLLNDVFSKTWGEAAGPIPEAEYWIELINGVREVHRNFLFIAEAYWDLESSLQQLGFDYCYDKRLYDRLVHDDARSVRDHLAADLSYQNRLIRFIENHDEARAAAVLPPSRLRAAAVAIASLPGATLYYEGEFSGARIHIPVQLGRAPDEPCDAELAHFYAGLRRCAHEMKSSDALWQLCEAQGWPDNQSADQLLSWTWQDEDRRFLVVINYADAPAQARLHLPWADENTTQWRLRDLLSGETFERDAAEMKRDGLYIARDGWGYHLLTFDVQQN
jgi:hypothetical protein